MSGQSQPVYRPPPAMMPPPYQTGIPGAPSFPGAPPPGSGYPVSPFAPMTGGNTAQAPEGGVQNLGTSGLNLNAWQGPYGAPLTNLQLDAMGAMERMLGADPLAQTQDIQQAIQQSLAQGTPTDLGGFYGQFGDVFRQAGQAGAPGSAAINQALGAGAFNTTPMYQAAEQAFGADLDEALARSREEFSGLGLAPGSTDRANSLARTAADSSARFRLGQEQIGMQAFENFQDRLMGGGQALAGIGLNQAGLQSSMLPLSLNAAQVPFQESLANRQMSAQTLPSLMQAFGLPSAMAGQAYAMGDAAQGSADDQISRMMAEFQRTQMGLFPYMQSMLGGPQMQAAYGPSTISQFAGLIPAGVDIYNAINKR